MTEQSKSCTTKHLDCGDLPTSDWSATRLIAAARRSNSEIVASETGVTVKYWYLGRALNVLRESAKYGDWESFLTELGIEKTRAYRARRIAMLFDSPDQLVGRTVKQACQSHCEQESRVSNEVPSIERLIRLLRSLAKQSRQLEQHIDQLNSTQAADLQEAMLDGLEVIESIFEIWEAEKPEDVLCPTVDSRDRS